MPSSRTFVCVFSRILSRPESHIERYSKGSGDRHETNEQSGTASAGRARSLLPPATNDDRSIANVTYGTGSPQE
ncbi:hypothetical protein BD413DRAFT_8534 [Trametes elegans]|nr:hypothetical protein BD413DRAFT_8534 [Trametes elegans]